MPTMVMSQLPKAKDSNNMRKRQKNKIDNIVPIHYMYVGTPKKKLCFYVRERLLYRPTVEVTYEEVFNYLAHITNDETISLHYSVNGLYVPITTTGQLHTFIRTVHNDSTAFLYVENQAYVWNVTPQNKGQKMEKRKPTDGSAPAAGSSEDAEKEEDEDEEDEAEDEADEENSQEDEEEDTQDYDEEEDEDEEEEENGESDDEKVPRPVTDGNAPMVIPEKMTVKKAFAEPHPRCEHLGEQLKDSSMKNNTPKFQLPPDNSSENPTPKLATISGKKWSEDEAYTHLRSILTDSLAMKKMGSVEEIIAEQIVRDVWNQEFPHDERVFKDSVTLLKASIGAGILCYHQQILDRFAPDDQSEDAADALDRMLIHDYVPTNNPQFLAEFIENATISACDILESVQHLAHLQQEFDWFVDVFKKFEDNTKNKKKNALPSLDDIRSHLQNSLVSARFGFSLLNPAFPDGCECKDAIQTILQDLEKLLTCFRDTLHKGGSDNQMAHLRKFMIESSHKIVIRFTEKECPLHETVSVALRDAETFTWRQDIGNNFEKWKTLPCRDHRPILLPNDEEIGLVAPLRFAFKPSGAIGDKNIVPLDQSLTDMHLSANPMTMPIGDSEPPMDSEEAVQNALGVARRPMEDLEPEEDDEDEEVATGQEEEPEYSPELTKMIENMIKNAPKEHNFVYPKPPSPGAILIPIGGLARCRCSKTCTYTLMEPAYEYMERFNEPRQTQWEKTKQKRFKKN